MESSGARINDFLRQELLSGGTYPISQHASVPIRECNEPTLYFEVNRQLSSGRRIHLRTLPVLFRKGFVGASSSDSSWLGLPIPLSVPDAKGEDDQRQAHHYRENTY